MDKALRNKLARGRTSERKKKGREGRGRDRGRRRERGKERRDNRDVDRQDTPTQAEQLRHIYLIPSQKHTYTHTHTHTYKHTYSIYLVMSTS